MATAAIRAAVGKAAPFFKGTAYDANHQGFK